MKSKKILVIGSANADLVIHTEKMPKLGETVLGDDFCVNSGGKGLNQAVAISKLGGETSFLGMVGDDSNGDMLLDTLKGFGVKFIGKKAPNIPTGAAIITIVNGDNFIVLNSGANNSLTPEIIETYSKEIMSADFLILQLEIPMDTIVKICEIAKSGKTKIILNPAPYKELPENLLSMVDILIPNEHEAKSITGIDPNSKENATAAIKRINEFGVKTAIITLGERGCVYNNNGETVFVPANKTEVVDTTSAGDSFIGALAVSLAQEHTLYDSICYANIVASITVSRKGAAKSIPFAHEIKTKETGYERT